MFDAVRAAGHAARLDKVVALAGDCASLELGLSAEDRDTLQREVHVFIHAAASVRFDDSLKSAVLLNTRGAQEAASLALGMQHLQVGLSMVPRRKELSFSLRQGLFSYQVFDEHGKSKYDHRLWWCAMTIREVRYTPRTRDPGCG